jgi:hypothetical protein
MTPVKASKALLGREVKASQVDYENPSQDIIATEYIPVWLSQGG